MKTAAFIASILLLGAFATAQACPYGNKDYRSTSVDKTIETYTMDATQDKTVVIKKTPLKGDIATTVEPTSTAN